MSTAFVRRPAPETLDELLLRARALEGRRLGELAEALGAGPLPESQARAKGLVGRLVEAALGADPSAGSGPDFPRLGVELKTIPVDARGGPVASTFCCKIPMADADSTTWERSRLRRRLAQVLFVPVSSRPRELSERRLGRAVLWRPSPEEEATLRADWELLMGRIGAGESEALSALEGVALQVRPKASSSRARTLAPGPDGPSWVLPLGFYLRARWTARILEATR